MARDWNAATTIELEAPKETSPLVRIWINDVFRYRFLFDTQQVDKE